MSEAAESFNPDGFAMPASNQKAFLKQYVPTDDDEGVIATFEKVMEHKPFLSEQKGEYVEEETDYVRIVVRGNDKLEVHRRVCKTGGAPGNDTLRFPYAWQQYQLGRQHEQRGTALDRIPGFPSRSLAFYHSKNVFTAEDLARVSDGDLQSLGTGAREFREKAKQLEKAKQHTSEQDRQLSEQSAQIQALIAQNAKMAEQLTAALQKLDAPPRKGAKEQ